MRLVVPMQRRMVTRRTRCLDVENFYGVATNQVLVFHQSACAGIKKSALDDARTAFGPAGVVPRKSNYPIGSYLPHF